jgi:hypothetical protein
MDDLLAAALRGTSRQPESAASHPTDELLLGVPIDSPERRLLLRAGVRAIYSLAGRPVVSVPEAPAACPPEREPVCSARATELLRAFLEHPRRELLEEALQLLAQAGQRLPPTLLPGALDRCERHLQPMLVAVLGERGRWLCKFHPRWRILFAAASAEDQALAVDADRIWSEGKLAERKALLERARRIDPSRGRQWLAEVWDKESADARHDLLATLEISLSDADVPFLESALADGSKKVRAIASLLLCRLPGSAVGQRMRSLGETILTFTAPRSEGKLRSFVKSLSGDNASVGKLTVTPPRQFEKAWEKDGLVEKPPPGRGQREFWLTQILERIPPTHWEERFRATPAELIAAVAEDDHGENVLQAWSGAARGFCLEPWVFALRDVWKSRLLEATKPKDQDLARQQLVELFPLLPREKLEELISSLLERGATEPVLSAHDWEYLPRPWSKEFSRTYLKAVRERSQTVQAASAFNILETIPIAAVGLAPACFEETLRPWDILDQPAMAYWKKAIDSFLEIVRGRSEFRQATLPSGDTP